MSETVSPAGQSRRRTARALATTGAKVLHWHLLAPWRRRELRRLALAPHPWAPRLAAAIRRVIADELSAEEREWARQIETLRRSLCASDDPVRRADFGAGVPGAEPVRDEAAAGVEVTETIGSCVSRLSKQPFWCRLLLTLVREFGPERAIEMGTAAGISAAYQAAAMELTGRGRLVTLEGSEALARIAAGSLESLGLSRVEVRVGRFAETLQPTLRELAPVDHVFVDGHHDEHATVGYFASLLPHLADPALVVFDDIAWSAGMRRAWRTLESHPRVPFVVDLGSVGLCVIGEVAPSTIEYRLPLNSSGGQWADSR
jgi:predicted O-methyltransferase YrrM